MLRSFGISKNKLLVLALFFSIFIFNSLKAYAHHCTQLNQFFLVVTSEGKSFTHPAEEIVKLAKKNHAKVYQPSPFFFISTLREIVDHANRVGGRPGHHGECSVITVMVLAHGPKDGGAFGFYLANGEKYWIYHNQIMAEMVKTRSIYSDIQWNLFSAACYNDFTSRIADATPRRCSGWPVNRFKRPGMQYCIGGFRPNFPTVGNRLSRFLASAKAEYRVTKKYFQCLNRDGMAERMRRNPRVAATFPFSQCFSKAIMNTRSFINQPTSIVQTNPGVDIIRPIYKGYRDIEEYHTGFHRNVNARIVYAK